MSARILVLLALVAAVTVGCGSAETAPSPAESSAPSAALSSEAAPVTSPSAEGSSASCETPGRYADYSAEAAADVCYTDTILFFHAPWCPECRGFEKAIEGGTVPDKTQILKVDYDSATDLRKKYGVTIQSTFVRVDATGTRIRLWSGYGQDKSVDAILEHTR
ncbi:thioredoxin family protein [Nocardioides luteus]|uniref:Thioredoxin domain-containing protein n=1 Tax=Nocardioides luteus TaxID=1844 RepID=A0A1J4N553_9ACTN|nr:thioredoxin family protein [Nocardioides luteus]OIJ26686.1 hypothetical protein UG56_011330 [Nocardioides luteus]